jgi:hypothetical protein
VWLQRHDRRRFLTATSWFESLRAVEPCEEKFDLALCHAPARSPNTGFADCAAEYSRKTGVPGAIPTRDLPLRSRIHEPQSLYGP